MQHTSDRRARRIRPAFPIDNPKHRAMKGQAGCELADREEAPRLKAFPG